MMALTKMEQLAMLRAMEAHAQFRINLFHKCGNSDREGLRLKFYRWQFKEVQRQLDALIQEMTDEA